MCTSFETPFVHSHTCLTFACMLYIPHMFISTILTEQLCLLQDGNTPLQHAAREGYITYVKHLLSTPGIAANTKNQKQQTPLMVTTKYDVITSLQKYSTCYEDYPVHTFNKVVLCGDTGAGKSTLAKVLRHAGYACSTPL